MYNRSHRFHLVDPSPWPLYVSLSMFLLFNTFVKMFESGCSSSSAMLDPFTMKGSITYSMISAVLCLAFWWKDVIFESTYTSYHTIEVEESLKSGMMFFIFSEVMFFFSFFWAFFNSSLCTESESSMYWPPMSIEALESMSVPLLNTVTLLSSSVSVTWAHHAIIINNNYHAINSMIITILLSVFFTMLQSMEYYMCTYTMASGNYSSVFFILTSFHSLHVLISTIFLIVSLSRMMNCHIDSSCHNSVLFSIWYWHFVDVVWLFLFVFVYMWGNTN